MFMSISIGPIALTVDSLLTIVSVISLWLLTAFFTRKASYKSFATDTLFYSLFTGLFAARVAFVIAMWEVYQHDWLSAIDIRDGGFNQSIGWFAGICIVLFRSKKYSQLFSIYMKSAAITAVAVFPFFVFNSMLSNQRTIETINVYNADSTPVELVLNNNKPTVINFWASWCPPCRREMPMLEYAQKNDVNIEYIFVNQGEAPSKVRQFLGKQKIDLKNTYFDFTGSTAKELGAFGLPTTLFFNAGGKLVDSHMGELSEASLQYYLDPLRKKAINSSD